MWWKWLGTKIRSGGLEIWSWIKETTILVQLGTICGGFVSKKKWGQICKPWLNEINNSWKQLELHRSWSFILPQVCEISPIPFPEPWNLKWIPTISKPNNPTNRFPTTQLFLLRGSCLDDSTMVSQIPQVVSKTWASKRDPWLFLNDTVDGSEIPQNHRLDVQNLVNNGINYQPQLVSLPDFWTINSIKRSGGAKVTPCACRAASSIWAIVHRPTKWLEEQKVEKPQPTSQFSHHSSCRHPPWLHRVGVNPRSSRSWLLPPLLVKR